jgi:hypothetical protein
MTAQGAPRKYRSRHGARGKYGAVKTTYNGAVYDSKLEAGRAMALDALQAAGRIAGWRRGRDWLLFNEPHPRKPRRRLKRVYRPDFEVWTAPDQSDLWLEDTKGVLTPVFRMKADLFVVVHPTVRLKVIKKDGSEEWL